MRLLRAAALLAVVGVAVASCETDVDNSLHIHNTTDEPITVTYELSSGEQVGGVGEVPPGRTRTISVPSDPDVEGEPRCTTGPLIIGQDGSEIERFEAPVCYGDGLTLDVDGKPESSP